MKPRTKSILSVLGGVALLFVIALAWLGISPSANPVNIGTDRFGLQLRSASSDLWPQQHIGARTLLTVEGPWRMVHVDVGGLRICLWSLPPNRIPRSLYFDWKLGKR